MKVMILWHMHQPMYGMTSYGTSLRTYSMPWTFLHAIREYYDMAEMVRRKKVSVTFNLVPSLLIQIEDYANGKADDIWLKHFLKPAEQLSESEREFIQSNFFSLNFNNFIKPYPGFLRLWSRRQEKLSVHDLRDLQVFWLLSQLSAFYHREDKRVKKLVEKGMNFSEYDKAQVYGIAVEILHKVTALYRELGKSSHVEISTTPFFHPILPLLIDTDIAKISMPNAPMPQKKFSHPEDAEKHVMEAVRFMKERGFDVQGMWPAEGSVSEDAVRLLSQFGIKWIATDEGILKRSGGADPHKPYIFEGVRIFFRDHGLSDAIGFTYQKWPPKRAVEDFISHLHEIRHLKSDSAVVSIILDGENPWPEYTNGGLDFLDIFYDRLQREFELVTPSDMNEDPEELKHIFPGSWIRSDFSMWIGNPFKNRAWEVLAEAREMFGKIEDTHEMASFEFMAAEGSDWFWWYGSGGSLYGDLFDETFRTHIKRAFTLRNLEIPEFLDTPISSKKRREFRPSGEIHPRLDGRISNYFEWLYSGIVDFQRDEIGAMMSANSILKAMRFGTDGKNLYLLIEASQKMKDVLKSHTLQINFKGETIIKVSHDSCILSGKNQEIELKSGLEDVLEIAVPLDAIEKDRVYHISIELIKDRDVVERHPPSGWFEICLEPDDWPL